LGSFIQLDSFWNMPTLNWGLISDGGIFESLMHAILFAENAGTILFGRPGKDSGQDARTIDGTSVYQAKYRQGLVMDNAIILALEELEKIRVYRQHGHPNQVHWRKARRWVLVANFSINPNDDVKWQTRVVPAFQKEGLAADYWHIDILEGKLSQHSEVRDVFFGDENRVLVGLKEAHDLLIAECVGSEFLDVAMMGRDSELSLIKTFAASGDKRVLPLVGPGGIGKSRLLYEGLIALVNEGWHVLWALPGTMAKSSQWFRLLNGAQQTCVAIDDPDDPGLLRSVIEQLSTVERRNWRVIIATRTEKAEALRRFRHHRHVHEPIELRPLDEPISQALINACLVGHAPPSWLHSVYRSTHGIPGWLCLIAELTKREALTELPSSIDDVASSYLDSCLSALGDHQRDQALTLLRWLALWGTLRETGNVEQAEFHFLESKGISAHTARNLLAQLVRTGIVRNWGVAKRLFAIEPLIIRQQILVSWILRTNADAYDVSDSGRELMTQLVKGQIPAVDSALKTLSQVVQVRLTESEAALFLRPIFSAMATSAVEGTLLDQYHVVSLVEKVGSADPESALDVLKTIREKVMKSMDIEDLYWGTQTLTHSALVANFPWTLFQIAECASDRLVARRYINEFRQLVALEDSDVLHASSGKKPRQLLHRLLCESKNSETFAQPAYELAIAELTIPTSWPFVGLLTGCLLNPIRESTEWVANWTLSISRRAFLPASTEWRLAEDLRNKIFAALRNDPTPAFRGPLWRVLAESHHSFHRAVMHGNVKGPAVKPYQALLVSDLETCTEILKTPPVTISVEEATAAREMWTWYLEYGKDHSLVVLANQCEDIYNNLPISRWRLNDFFQFDRNDKLAPETARIAAAFRSATGPEVISEFFEAAKQYLNAARQGHRDGADDRRIFDLAKVCGDQLDLDPNPAGNALSLFVKATLDRLDAEHGNMLAWEFAVRLCQRHLFTIKSKGDQALALGLAEILEITKAKSRLLWGLYSNVHPATTGTLTSTELKYILQYEDGFSVRDQFCLLGAFNAVDSQTIQDRLHANLQNMRNDPVEASHCLEAFIISVHIAALRYIWPPQKLPVAWIIEMISKFGIDGSLFDMYELEWLRDQAGYHMTINETTKLIRSRMALEKSPKPSDSFLVIPLSLKMDDWCKFDQNKSADRMVFRDFCALALEQNVTAILWMPKFLAQIDPTGSGVADFVNDFLASNPRIDGDRLVRLGYLGSAYEDTSDAWANIAKPICQKAEAFSRDVRERTYFGLARKQTPVLTSMPGEVADWYVQVRDDAKHLLELTPDESPLKDYRRWALRRAEDDLRREEGIAEEVTDD
jgi:hypothetical protein